jgi:ribosomal protein S25
MDEIDKAVDKLFGPYKVKSKDILEDKLDIPHVPDKKNKIIPPDKGEIDQIKLLTAKMLKRLNQAVKSDSWTHRLYYSHQFMQIAMSIAKRITKRK